MSDETVGVGTIGARLAACRESLGLGQTAMAKKLEMSPSTLKNIESNSNVPTGETLLRYASLGFNPGWVLTASGEMLLPPPSVAGGLRAGTRLRSKPVSAETEDITSSIVLIERLAFAASAGTGSLVIEDAAGTVPVSKELLYRLHMRPEDARMLDSSGDSMLPTIADGDPLLLDVSPDARSRVVDNKIYAFTVGNEAFLKRLRREPGSLMMVSDNAEGFPARPVPAGEVIRIIGRVRWGAREL